MKDVAARVVLMTGGTGSLDFSRQNDNDLVNPGESRRKWKTVEQFAKAFGGRPRQAFKDINV
jgi:hypothetical protein